MKWTLHGECDGVLGQSSSDV